MGRDSDAARRPEQAVSRGTAGWFVFAGDGGGVGDGLGGLLAGTGFFRRDGKYPPSDRGDACPAAKICRSHGVLRLAK